MKIIFSCSSKRMLAAALLYYTVQHMLCMTIINKKGSIEFNYLQVTCLWKPTGIDYLIKSWHFKLDHIDEGETVENMWQTSKKIRIKATREECVTGLFYCTYETGSEPIAGLHLALCAFLLYHSTTDKNRHFFFLGNARFLFTENRRLNITRWTIGYTRLHRPWRHRFKCTLDFENKKRASSSNSQVETASMFRSEPKERVSSHWSPGSLYRNTEQQNNGCFCHEIRWNSMML